MANSCGIPAAGKDKEKRKRNHQRYLFKNPFSSSLGFSQAFALITSSQLSSKTTASWSFATPIGPQRSEFDKAKCALLGFEGMLR